MAELMPPSAIVFREITLGDRGLICTYLGQESFMISDISFGNLFLWRHARKIEFAVIHECLVIKTTYPNKPPFVFFPIGAGDKLCCLRVLKSYFASLGLPLEFHSLEASSVEMLNCVFGAVEARLNRDRSDYIYLTSNLINLSGRKYHKKKNHLNRFFEEYKGFEFEEISSSNLDEVAKACDLWSKNKSDVCAIDFNINSSLENEWAGIRALLHDYDALGLRGGLLRHDGKIIAFSFGEVVSNSLCVIHVEKADTNYRGAYQAINQQLLANCFQEVTYVNREEDLGIEGLRKAKLSYNPDLILDKYEAIIPTS